MESSFSYLSGQVCFFNHHRVGFRQAVQPGVRFPDQTEGFLAFFVSGGIVGIDQVVLDAGIKDPKLTFGRHGKARYAFGFTVDQYEVILFPEG